MRGNMAEIRLPFTRHDKDARGNERWYWVRKNWPKVRLNPKGVEIGSPEFFERYQNAENQWKQGKVRRSSFPDGALGNLIDAYLASTAFEELRPTTQESRGRLLRHLQNDHGDKSSEMTSAAVRAGRDARKDTPAAANNRVKAISALYTWAVETGRATHNPAAGVKRLKEGPGYHTWTRDEIKTYRQRWDLGTRERLTLELFYGLAQRRSDIVRLGPQHIAGDSIRLVQEKTGKALVLPISAELAEALRVTPPSSPLSFLGYRNADSMTNMFRRWCDEAGLPKRCSSHGLRKARATHLAEAGKTPHQIAAITGHATLSEVQRYTAAVDQERLAREAFAEQNVPKRGPALETGTSGHNKGQQ